MAGGGALTVIGMVTGASFIGTSGTDTVVDSQSGQDIVYELNGTETKRVMAPVTCTATGGLAKYDTCITASPITTTGAITKVSIECGNVAESLTGDLSFVEAVETGTGTALVNFDNAVIGTGATVVFNTGSVLWNPTNYLKFGTLSTLTGTLNTTRYDCVMKVEVDNIYGR